MWKNIDPLHERQWCYSWNLNSSERFFNTSDGHYKNLNLEITKHKKFCGKGE